MKTDSYIITVKHTGRFDTTLLGDMIAARAWTLDSVENAEAKHVPATPYVALADSMKDVTYQPAFQFVPRKSLLSKKRNAIQRAFHWLFTGEYK